MPSSDARTLIQAAVPTAAVGAVAVAIGSAVEGGKGAIGAVVATVLVILLMGAGLYVLLRTAKSLPHLFQAMGLMMYMAQLLLMFTFVALFKNTTLFHPKVFGLTLLVCTLTWVAAQARAHMKAKTLYVEPDSTTGEKKETQGHSS
jgi:ATP synthase protein I